MSLFRWWRNEPGCYVDRQCMIADCEFSLKVYSDDWRDKVSNEVVYCAFCGHTADCWDALI